MDNINDRIKHLFESYNFKSYAEFSKKTNISHQTASNYIKGKQKPDISKIVSIYEYFKDDILAEWFFTGKGEKKKNYDVEFNYKSDLNIPVLLKYLIDNQNELVKDPTFKKYIQMNNAHFSLEEDRKNNAKAIEELRKKAIEKYSKKN